MHRNNPSKRPCVVCGKSGSVLICHGCQLSYCAKHVIKHREELSNKLESIIYDHDLLRQDIDQSSNEYFQLRKIDKWEKESIEKIQIIAETARMNLRQIVVKSKRRLKKISQSINFDLNASWKADDFSENDLKKWMKQLNELRGEIKAAYSIQLIENQQDPIYPILVTDHPFRNQLNNKRPSNLIHQECFIKATNCASIENNGLIVKHIGPNSDYAHILGKQLYSKGRHTTRFKIQQSTLPYSIFFGCISSEIPQKSINYNSSAVVGWFGYNEIYQHGIWNNNSTLHGYDSNEIETDDIIQLTFDCDQRCIELFHERLNKTYRLAVNIEKAPFPWQILVVLLHADDCVKILPKK